MHRIKFLNTPLDVANMQETVSFISARIDRHEFLQHVAVNVAKLVNMQKDGHLATSVRACDLINIDGMGIVFGARFLGYKIPGRVTGIDLFHNLLEMSANRGFPVFLLGAEDTVVYQAVEKIKQQHSEIKIAGYHHGYFWGNEEAVVEKIRASGARLLFVAMSSPKKENFINEWKDGLGVDFVMGVGGTLDVVAGKVKRAPEWMQNIGLEWFYRILQEPCRMWKRYTITNTLFAGMLIKEKVKGFFH
jgi:N-acetylglucosaminyldiphosphoundecaprenol N-acetyl-beta-D-mannosaminyltransferase